MPSNRISKVKEFKLIYFSNKYKVDIVFLIFAGLYLSIVLNSLYISDDNHNYVIGRAILDGTNYFGQVLESFYFGIGIGRFAPINIVLFPIMIPFQYLLQSDILIYKSAVVLLTLIDLMLAGYIVRFITKSEVLKYCAMVFILFSFTFTSVYKHMPLYTFYCQMQFVVLFLLIATIFCLKYLRSPKKKYIIFAIIFFVLAMFHYEVSYTFILLPILLCFLYGKRGIALIKCSIPVVSSFIVCTLIYIIMKKVFGPESEAYGGVSVSLDIVKIIKTYVYQTFAAVPLSGWIGGFITERHQDVYIYSLFSLIKFITFKDILLIVFWTILFVMLYIKMFNEKQVQKKYLYIILLIGAYFWFIPGSLIALTLKYQNELYFGIGYNTVFLENFGVGIFIASIIGIISSYLPVRMRMFFISLLWLLGCFIIIITQVNGRRCLDNIHVLEKSYNYANSWNAVEAGIMSDINDNDSVVTNSHFGDVGNGGYVRNSFALSQIIRKRIQAFSSEEYLNNPNMISSGHIYFFDTIKHDNKDSFFVSVATNAQESTNKNILFDNFKIFVPKGYSNSHIKFLKRLGKIGDCVVIHETKKGTIYDLKTNNMMELSKLSDTIYQILKNVYLSDNMIEFGREYSFNENNPEFILDNFSWIETWGRWTEGKNATLIFMYDKNDCGFGITASVKWQTFYSTKTSISVSGRSLINVDADTTPTPFRIAIPAGSAYEEYIAIDFAIPNAMLPAEIGGNPLDNRKLGFGLISIIFSCDSDK